VNCYITGVLGFLGSHLADYLTAQGHFVSGCDDLSTGDVNNTFNCRLAVRSIEDLTPADLRDVDIVYHCAALAYEGVSSFSPSLISRNVYAGSAAVFSAAIAGGVKRIVFCSSMARYGEPSTWDKSFTEKDTPRPVDPYGIAKEAAERLLINLCQTHGVEWLIAVPHNIYGPRQAIDPYRNVCTIFANRLLLGKQPIIYGDGSQVRCFSYVDDVVPSLARMGTHAAGEVINLGPDRGEVTILELARTLADVVGVPCDPIFLPPRPREVKVALCSARKARDLLGFEQGTDLRGGLVKLVEWFRAKGPRPFKYHLPIEIDSPSAPTTWTKRTM
jgi:UDP-glucose 4-epimerase